MNVSEQGFPLHLESGQNSIQNLATASKANGQYQESAVLRTSTNNAKTTDEKFAKPLKTA